jgi:hypothetical protein
MDRRRLTQRNPAHTATPVSMRRTRAATSAGRARAGGGLPPVTQESVRALLDGAFAASPAPPPDLVNSILSLIPTASAAAAWPEPSAGHGAPEQALAWAAAGTSSSDMGLHHSSKSSS